MKGDRGGCTPRSIGSGMSQTCGSSHLASKNCGCGERLLLLKATTLKNKGRLFYRCRNWAVRDFEMEGSLQRKSEEVEVCIENVVLDLRKKKDKLKKKLEEERKKFQNDVGVFCIVMGINSYVLYSVCVEATLEDALLPPSRIVANPPACDVDASPAPASLADLLPACDADADAPLPAIDATPLAIDADAPLPADATLLDADPGVDVEALLLSYERSKIVR
ncbi:hypothetical protein LR48_Vigan01g140700 [Vigna angularis]|uniref:Zinc finger GRF-type domain-containing protein n=1 Tax=Phaseolus angularis TaxID=3914 RepID=A0A0L9TN02_PHAAN|nr:hypothetical protein LR48_Vigan01g140700 [Vigna angularis]